MTEPFSAEAFIEKTFNKAFSLHGVPNVENMLGSPDTPITLLMEAISDLDELPDAHFSEAIKMLDPRLAQMLDNANQPDGEGQSIIYYDEALGIISEYQLGKEGKHNSLSVLAKEGVDQVLETYGIEDISPASRLYKGLGEFIDDSFERALIQEELDKSQDLENEQQNPERDPNEFIQSEPSHTPPTPIV